MGPERLRRSIVQAIQQDIQMGVPAAGDAEHFVAAGQAPVGDRQQHGASLFRQFESYRRAALILFGP